jgi:cell division protein FtsB
MNHSRAADQIAFGRGAGERGAVRVETGGKLRQILGPLFGAAVMAYFAYHAVQGDRGLLAWWNLRFELDRANAELAEVSAEKRLLEHRVSLLRPESLDRDMLEERARIMLGVADPRDLIVPDPGAAR